MPLVNAGRDHLVAASLGEAVTNFNNANAHLGVGDGTTAVAATDTDLVGVNKLRKAMMATYPTRTGNQATFRASFGGTEANFTWAEWGIFNAATAGTMMSRKVEALGTKASGSTWELTTTLTLTI